MKPTRILMSLLAAGMLSCAAPLAFAQGTSSTQDTGMQHPQSGAITHTPPMTSPPMSGNTSGTMSDSSSSQSGMSSASTGPVMGQHDMTGTVESVSSNGMVHVNCEGMNLRLHFPDASQNLKKGDKITLHLSYTKQQ